MIPAQRVLVADDDRSFLLRIKILLSASGCKVDTVMTLSEAVRMATQGETPYDYIILDQRFPPPSIDGIEATTQIRNVHPDAKVILLTLFGDSESCHQALEARVFRYIVRPFPDDALVSILKYANAVDTLTNELRAPSLLRRTLDKAGIGISVVDRSYRILYMNEHQRNISHKGCREGGICWLEYNPSTIARGPCTWCPTKPALETGNTEVGTTISVVDDKVRYFSVVASPITAADGDSPIAVMEFVRDITEEFTADQAVIQATETDTRLKGILAKVCALGFSRARLYELTEDDVLVCRAAFGGEDFDVTKVRISVDGDAYWERTLGAVEPIIHEKRPEYVADYEQVPGWKDVDEWMDVPLRSADRILGKISIDNMVLRPVPPGEAKPIPRKLSLTRKDEIMKIALWAANEIAREREAVRNTRESERLRELRQLSVLVAGVSSLEQDLEDIVKASAKVTGADGVHLRLCTDEGLKMMAGHGPYYEAASRSREIVSFADVGSGSVRAFNKQGDVVEQDSSRDHALRDFIASLSDLAMREALTSVRSSASFPIMFEGQALGIINLQSNRKRFFGPTALEAARDFAAMIGPILRIQGLIDELPAAQERLRMASRTAAHRINNPNAAIQSRVAWWQGNHKAGQMTEQDLTELMQGIATDAGRIAGIVRDLRRFLQGAKGEAPASPINAVEVIRQTLSGMLVGRHGLEFTDEMEVGLPPTRLDPRLIASIADELAADACKAMAGKGVYRVRARLANEREKSRRHLAVGRGFLRFEFCDTGPGVPTHLKEWIFGPFNTTFSDGTGLGLAYVRDSARELGGVIHEEGTPGQGAQFVLMLPVQS